MGTGVQGGDCGEGTGQKSVWYVDQHMLLFWEIEESRELLKWMRMQASCMGVKQIDESCDFWTTAHKALNQDGACDGERN